MFKEILFTHDDMDGAGCRIIFELAHHNLQKGTTYDVINCSNGGIDYDVELGLMRSGVDPKETIIYFGDIAPSIPVLQKLKDEGYDVRIFDHHRTNFPVQQIFPNATIVVENDLGVMQSGTSLMYQFYSSVPYVYGVTDSSQMNLDYFYKKGNQELLAKFVDTIRSYDTYEWKEKGNMEAKQLQTLFFMLGMERFCERYLRKIMEPGQSNNLIDPSDMDFVMAKIENEQRAINYFTLEDVFPINVRGYNIALVLSTKGASISELAYQFLRKYPQFDAMISFSLSRNGKFEMRTARDDLDIANLIAKPIGGGGHAKAAGASLPPDRIDELKAMLIDTLNTDIDDKQQG